MCYLLYAKYFQEGLKSVCTKVGTLLWDLQFWHLELISQMFTDTQINNIFSDLHRYIHSTSAK
jgi:hypothetical protein